MNRFQRVNKLLAESQSKLQEARKLVMSSTDADEKVLIKSGELDYDTLREDCVRIRDEINTCLSVIDMVRFPEGIV